MTANGKVPEMIKRLVDFYARFATTTTACYNHHHPNALTDIEITAHPATSYCPILTRLGQFGLFFGETCQIVCQFSGIGVFPFKWIRYAPVWSKTYVFFWCRRTCSVRQQQGALSFSMCRRVSIKTTIVCKQTRCTC